MTTVFSGGQPVIVIDNNTGIPVDFTSPGLPSGGATSANQTSGNATLTSIDGHVDGLETLVGTTNTEVGGLTETAPASDTASSGLNGRLQRIAQRITSLIALLPASLGRKSSALSLAVVASGMGYETVAASQTDQVLGSTGAAGDYLSHIVIQPTTTGAGTVLVKDGGTTIFTFTTGTLTSLASIPIPFGIFSTGALTVTTGANVAVLTVGNYT